MLKKGIYHWGRSLEEIDVNGIPSKNFKVAIFSTNEALIDQISRRK
jgi:hypothetical protein